tara:strand:+ start:11129 stop:12418 length:1290 start_codon:yes stop_codon:yes gene_type:complete
MTSKLCRFVLLYPCRVAILLLILGFEVLKMSSKLLGLVVVFIGSSIAYAQSDRSNSLRDELRNEVGQLYSQSGGEALDREELAQRSYPQPVEAAPVVVPRRSAPSFERRPKAVVESSPLDESKAARLRRQREGFEAETEMRIVEKLEEDRIESERKRAARLFGGKLDNEEQEEMYAPQQVQPVAPVVVAPPAPVVDTSADDELAREDFKQDLREVITEMKSVENVEEEDFETLDVGPIYYLMPSIGLGNYPGIDNVEGAYSIGINLGAEYMNGLMVEGSFNLSSYDLYNCYGSSSCNYSYNQNNLLELTQYSVGTNVKYQFNSSGRLRPVVGGVVSLTMREYEQVYYSSGTSNVKSYAMDLGLLGGVNVDVSDVWSVAVDFRYMFNLTNRVDRNSVGGNTAFINNSYANATPVEDLDYYLFNVGMKFKF